MCLGIPSFETVRSEINANGRQTEVRTPFAILVWQGVDGFNYWQADAKSAERMLKSAYEAAREFVMTGGELPQPRVAIAAPDGSSERLAEKIAYIRQQHHYGAITDDERDHMIAEANQAAGNN